MPANCVCIKKDSSNSFEVIQLTNYYKFSLPRLRPSPDYEIAVRLGIGKGRIRVHFVHVLQEIWARLDHFRSGVWRELGRRDMDVLEFGRYRIVGQGGATPPLNEPLLPRELSLQGRQRRQETLFAVRAKVRVLHELREGRKNGPDHVQGLGVRRQPGAPI